MLQKSFFTEHTRVVNETSQKEEYPVVSVFCNRMLKKIWNGNIAQDMGSRIAWHGTMKHNALLPIIFSGWFQRISSHPPKKIFS